MTATQLLFRTRPSTRDLRPELLHPLGLPGRPPAHPIEFDRMLRAALDEVLEVMPGLHPMWDDTAPDLIALCDREAAHGNVRAWAKITHHLNLGLRQSGCLRADEDLLRRAYSKLRTRQSA
jgi:hypothetical protein